MCLHQGACLEQRKIFHVNINLKMNLFLYLHVVFSDTCPSGRLIGSVPPCLLAAGVGDDGGREGCSSSGDANVLPAPVVTTTGCGALDDGLDTLSGKRCGFDGGKFTRNSTGSWTSS